MKLTTKTLKRMIKEELDKLMLKEGFTWLLNTNKAAIMNYLGKQGDTKVSGATMIVNAILKDLEDSNGKIAYYLNNPDQASGHGPGEIRAAAKKVLGEIQKAQENPEAMMNLLLYMAKDKDVDLLRRDVEAFVIDKLGEEIVSPLLQRAGLNK
jgi:hypothetical protein